MRLRLFAEDDGTHGLARWRPLRRTKPEEPDAGRDHARAVTAVLMRSTIPQRVRPANDGMHATPAHPTFALTAAPQVFKAPPTAKGPVPINDPGGLYLPGRNPVWED